MTPTLFVLHFLLMLVVPFLFVGLVNRTRAIWAGRRGQPLLQSLFDLQKLLRKRPVYSQVTTELFRLGPLVVLATTLVSGLLLPLTGRSAPISFPYDFVAVAYLWGLGRLFLILAAMDTGSAFEGMGASREASYAALVEPGLFLALGTLAAASGHTSFAGMVALGHQTPALVIITLACLVALLLVLQFEAARVPVDDPATHLELTMIHEVMILDHSGPDLAALQYAAAMKMTLCASLIAALVNPLGTAGPSLAGALLNIVITAGVAVGIGLVESLVARLRMRAVPVYALVVAVAGGCAMLVNLWREGGGR
jgi:formate hydrogenlyase subunit 4